MSPRKELDLKVAGYEVGRALEEIIFCTVNPAQTGPARRDLAIHTFGESLVKFVKVAESNA